MPQKFRFSLSFDQVLLNLYKEEKCNEINPVLYVVKHFELLKTQVDLYYTSKNLEDYPVQESYLKIINQIEEYQAECIQNCYNNLDTIQERFKEIIKETTEIDNYMQQNEYLVKTQRIRHESKELRGEIFKRNFIFIDKLGNKDVGSLIIIEPFCLDDSQIYIIK